MTKTEFIATRKRIFTSRSWQAHIFFGTFVLCIVFWTWIRSRVNELEVAWLSNAVNEYPWGLAAVYFIVGLAISVRLACRSVKRAGLFCPHCSELLNDTLGQMAIATDNCGICGKPVFEEHNRANKSTAEAATSLLRRTVTSAVIPGGGGAETQPQVNTRTVRRQPLGCEVTSSVWKGGIVNADPDCR